MIFLSVPFIGAQNSPPPYLMFGQDSHRTVKVLGYLRTRGNTHLSPPFEIQFVRIYHERFCLNYLSFLLYCPTFLDKRELCTAKQATIQPPITNPHIKKPGFLEL